MGYWKLFSQSAKKTGASLTQQANAITQANTITKATVMIMSKKKGCRVPLDFQLLIFAVWHLALLKGSQVATSTVYDPCTVLYRQTFGLYWSLLVTHVPGRVGGRVYRENQFEAGFEKYSYFRLSPFILKTISPLFWHFQFFTVSRRGQWLVGWFWQKQTTNYLLSTFWFWSPFKDFQGWEGNSGRGYCHPLNIPSSPYPLAIVFYIQHFPSENIIFFSSPPKKIPERRRHWMQFGKKWIFYNPFNIPPSEAFWQARPIHKRLSFREK